MSLEDLFESEVGEKPKKEEKKSTSPNSFDASPPEQKSTVAEVLEKATETKNVPPNIPLFASADTMQVKETNVNSPGGVKEVSSLDEVLASTDAKLKTEPSTPPQPRKQPVVVDTSKFDVTEESVSGKEVITIYGMKGHGKTFLSLSAPGKVSAVSFDHKTQIIHQKGYQNDPRIKVYDGLRYMDYSSPESELASSETTFAYIQYLLRHIKAEDKPDWVVIDGSEILTNICELVMRSRNNLMPFQGIANRNLWKERRMYIKQINKLALDASNRGLIWTTYTDKDELVIEGEMVTKTNVPKWVDAIMYETDTVIYAYSCIDQKGTGRIFKASVESSKGTIPTGTEKDITGAGLEKLGLK